MTHSPNLNLFFFIFLGWGTAQQPRYQCMPVWYIYLTFTLLHLLQLSELDLLSTHYYGYNT